MTITAAHIQPIVALIAGVLILIMPRFLNFVVAIYLIFIGLAGLGLFKLLQVGLKPGTRALRRAAQSGVRRASPSHQRIVCKPWPKPHPS